MEKPILKKTIQITYPAPYSQTWSSDQMPVLVKKTLGRNIKSAKFFNTPKTRMVTPRALSQSHATVRVSDPTAPHLKYGVFPNRRAASFSGHGGRMAQSPRAWSQSYDTVPGPDPTLPHLKYGKFPNKRVPASRPQPKLLPLKPIQNPHGHNLHSRQNPQDFLFNRNNIKKKPLKKAVPEPTKLIFRTIDNRYSRQLSLSEVMHIDIKPRQSYPISPSFCPSPTFKILSPKLSPTL